MSARTLSEEQQVISAIVPQKVDPAHRTAQGFEILPGCIAGNSLARSGRPRCGHRQRASRDGQSGEPTSGRKKTERDQGTGPNGMQRKMMMSLAFGLAVVTTGQSSAAQTGGKTEQHVQDCDRRMSTWRLWRVPPFQIASSKGCSQYYWKWKTYGGLYWKTKYLTCTGIY